MADTSLSVVELFMVFKYNKNNNVEFVGGQAMLIERMNLKLVGFNDEEIKTFCSY